MDNQYWLSANPAVVLECTKKLFYKEYLYKVSYRVDSAKLINNLGDGNTIVDQLAQLRFRQLASHYRIWDKSVPCSADLVDPVILEHFRALKEANPLLKYRLGDNSFNVYANNESALKTFNNAVPQVYASTLISAVGPKDAAQQQLLLSGNILGPNKLGFKFKIMLCDGAYPAAGKQQLLAYLDSLGEVVAVPKSTRRVLSSPFNYSYGSYLYTNDISVLSFINLVVPGITGTTYELAKI